jgi:hypothetical protein
MAFSERTRWMGASPMHGWAGLDAEQRVHCCLALVVDGITATPDDVRALDERAVQEVEDDQPVRLAHAYRCFLASAGMGAGRFLQGSDVFHPRIIGVRRIAQELLDEQGLALEDNDRVILMHQGYQFDFLRGEGADPEVWSCTEGEVPERRYACFTDWLRANAEEQTKAWAHLATLYGNG